MGYIFITSLILYRIRWFRCSYSHLWFSVYTAIWSFI